MTWYVIEGDRPTLPVDISADGWEAVVVTADGEVVDQQKLTGRTFTFSLPEGYTGPFEIHVRREGDVRVAAEGVCIPTQGECP